MCNSIYCAYTLIFLCIVLYMSFMKRIKMIIIGIFDLPRKKDGELTFNYFLLKHKENDLEPLYNR